MKITPIQTFLLRNDFPVEVGVEDRFPLFVKYGFIVFRISDHEQRPLYGLLSWTFPESYETIRPHEHVINEKLLQKKNDIQAGTMIGKPVCLLYHQDDKLSNLLQSGFENGQIIFHLHQENCLYEYAVYDHKAWARQVIEQVGEQDTMVIADGHHRTAAYFEKKKDTGKDQGLFSALIPLDQAKIHSYHRIISVSDLQYSALWNLLEDQYLMKASPPREAINAIDHARAEDILLYNRGQWRKLDPLDDPGNRRPGSADLLLQFEENVIKPFCALYDLQIFDQVKYISGTELKLEEMVSDPNDFLVLFPPVSREFLWNSSLCGEIMPAKSTWIEPRMPADIIQVPNDI